MKIKDWKTFNEGKVNELLKSRKDMIEVISLTADYEKDELENMSDEELENLYFSLESDGDDYQNHGGVKRLRNYNE